MWFVFLRITAGSVSVRVWSGMRSNKEPESALCTTKAEGALMTSGCNAKTILLFLT